MMCAWFENVLHKENEERSGIIRKLASYVGRNKILDGIYGFSISEGIR